MRFKIRSSFRLITQIAVFIGLLAIVFSCGLYEKKQKQEPFVLLKAPVVR